LILAGWPVDVGTLFRDGHIDGSSKEQKEFMFNNISQISKFRFDNPLWKLWALMPVAQKSISAGRKKTTINVEWYRRAEAEFGVITPTNFQ
jgi:membrane-bound lytic murein transglycosylase B